MLKGRWLMAARQCRELRWPALKRPLSRLRHRMAGVQYARKPWSRAWPGACDWRLTQVITGTNPYI